MPKVTLDTVASGYDLSKVNANFQSIEDELNNRVLYRNNTDGTADTLENNIDANGKRIYNLAEPLSNAEPARLQDVQNALAGGAANLISNTPAGNIVATNVQAAINELDTEKASLAQLAATSGSGLVGYLPPGTNVVATTVEAELDRNKVVPERFSGVDDFAKISNALSYINSIGGGLLWLENTYTLTAGQILNLSVSNLIIDGPGTVIGPSIATQGVPSAYSKIQGTLSTAVNYSSTITKNTSSFTVTNTFAADDMVVLSNFPTDATDAYTETAVDWKGEKRRAYATTNSSNKRQTRRRELVTVRSASGSAFELLGGTQHAYSDTTQLKFQKVVPVRNVKIRNITLENIWLLIDYARDIEINCNCISSCIEVRSTLGIDIDIPVFDAKDTSCLIDLHDQTTGFKVKVIGQGGNVSSDNGIVRIDQVGRGHVDVNATGTKGSMYAFLSDTNFTENPLGYTDVPNGPLTGNIVCSRCAAPNVFLTCDPYAAKIENVTLDVSSDLATNDALYLKGVDGVNINISAKDARIRFDGVQNTRVRGNYSSYFESTYTDLRSGAVQSNTKLDIYFEGTWTPSVGGTATYNTGNTKGHYVRNGRFVDVSFDIHLDVIGTGSTSTVSGLPHVASTMTRYPGEVAYFANLAVSPVAVFPYVGAGTTTIQFDGLTAAANVTSALSPFGNGSRLIGHVRYRIA